MDNPASFKTYETLHNSSVVFYRQMEQLFKGIALNLKDSESNSGWFNLLKYTLPTKCRLLIPIKL